MQYLRAKKTIYLNGELILRGNFYELEDRLASKHVAQGKGEIVHHRSKPVAEDRHTKPGAKSRESKS